MEREEYFRDYLDNWDFELFPLMPINEGDAEMLRDIFAKRQKDREYKAQWYQEHKEEKLAQSNKRNKEKAFIKKGRQQNYQASKVEVFKK